MEVSIKKEGVVYILIVEVMENINAIERLVSIQQLQKRNIPIDIILKNGNILIRSFLLSKFDVKRKLIEGFTRLESYSSLRERREPVACKFKLNEIREFMCSEIELEPA